MYRWLGGILVLTTLVGFSFFNLRRAVEPSLPTPARAVGPDLTQRIFLLVFDPFLPNRQKKLSEFFNNPYVLANQIASGFRSFTGNHVSFVIIEQKVVDDFNPKEGGFKHTEETFFDCQTNPRGRDYCESSADFNSIVSNYDFCGKVNRGEIDEVWLYAPPRAGFFESALIGPRGFPYNGPTLSHNSCRKTVPWMAFNYEREINEAVHNFTHRTEATGAEVYGGWIGDRPNPNSWEKFGMVRFQSPSFPYAGCGSSHFTPNARSDKDGYIYDITADSFYSICDSFYNYPNLGDPSQIKRLINCSEWGCSEYGYYSWWFRHIPRFTGTDSFGRFNDWWQYILSPEKALNV